LEEVQLVAAHKVLTVFDDSIFPIVGNPKGILGLQLRACPIHLLNVIIVFDNFVKLCVIRSFLAEDHTIWGQCYKTFFVRDLQIFILS
jgi:hypothetical protein